MRLLIICCCFFIFLLYLILEKIYLSSIVDDVPIRICITGSRGKSSVVRLVHAALIRNDIKALGKTTGSRSSLLLPDGTEENIYRRGPQSILEQRKILRKAHSHGVDAYVIETMSIRPEYRFVEARRILKPNLIGVTKITKDHLSEMGNDKKEIVEGMVTGIPPGRKVVVIDKDFLEYPIKFPQNSEIEKVRSSEKDNDLIEKVLANLDYWEFEENVRLALKIAEQANISPERATKGMMSTRPDAGALRAWKLPESGQEGDFIGVSAFAANEPESTEKALEIAKRRLSVDFSHLMGLLNLRKDRGSRTLQWKDALIEGRFNSFDRIYVIGEQATKFQNMLREEVYVEAMKFRNPEDLMSKLSSFSGEGGIIFGFGNVKGAGEQLIEHWSNAGESI